MQHTWHTCGTPSVCAQLMLDACCFFRHLISVRIRSSHTSSYNCFNMQFDRANRQVGFAFMLDLGMLKELTDIWQCCESCRDCMSFLKYSSSPTAPAADCWIFLCCVLRTQIRGLRNSDSAFTNFRILRGTL